MPHDWLQGADRITHMTQPAAQVPGGNPRRGLSLPDAVGVGVAAMVGAGLFVDGRAEAAAHSWIHGSTSGRPAGFPTAANSSSLLTVPPPRRSIRDLTITRAYTSPSTTARCSRKTALSS